MVNEVRADAHFHGLLQDAKKLGVQVHLFPKDGCDWEGLYMVAPDGKRGIAIREDLPIEWKVWTLAHELGHASTLNRGLFSPFGLAPHSGWQIRESRLGRWRRLSPGEDQANRWAAQRLIDPVLWDSVERRWPLDLIRITNELGLPFPAGLAWDLCRRSKGGRLVAVPLGTAGLTRLRTACTGRGGHQSLFRRILKSRGPSGGFRISFSDFSLARERYLTVGGGWLWAYETVLTATASQISAAGGVKTLFQI